MRKHLNHSIAVSGKINTPQILLYRTEEDRLLKEVIKGIPAIIAKSIQEELETRGF